MTKVIAYIGLGSNLVTPEAQIFSARQAIIALDEVEEQAFSSLYKSPPMGPKDQPDYVNAMIAVATTLPAMILLRQLQKIELAQGRVRKAARWGARTLDLDIIMYGTACFNEPDLIVPHYGMAERAFVLYPLQEIAPNLNVPGKGALSDLVADCPLEGLVKIAA